GPNDLRVRGVDGDGADRLHVLTIEDRFERGAAIDRFPDAAACGASEDGQPSVVIDGGNGGHAAAHLRRTDVASCQTGDGSRIEPRTTRWVRLLSQCR